MRYRTVPTQEWVFIFGFATGAVSSIQQRLASASDGALGSQGTTAAAAAVPQGGSQPTVAGVSKRSKQLSGKYKNGWA